MNNVKFVFTDNLTLTSKKALEQVKPNMMVLVPFIRACWEKHEWSPEKSAGLKYMDSLSISAMGNFPKLDLAKMENLNRLSIDLNDIRDEDLENITKYILKPLKSLRRLQVFSFTSSFEDISYNWNLSNYLPKSLVFLSYSSKCRGRELLKVNPNLECVNLIRGKFNLDVTLSQAHIKTNDSNIRKFRNDGTQHKYFLYSNGSLICS
ncbi:hypothetical protein DAMA08_013380 [Martiniozyma asiatica (nom. inval.)]|nr:hypothetical protein DAMA08_013380 [Martiniozyma asiatica]